jgi:hypothetical protein
LVDAYWKDSSGVEIPDGTIILEGTLVYMFVQGTLACADKSVTFDLYEDDFTFDDFIGSFSGTILPSGALFIAWTTEWIDDGFGNPEYYFEITLDETGDSLISGNIEVDSTEAICGNGVVEGTEECDDGIDNTDTCSVDYDNPPRSCDYCSNGSDGNTECTIQSNSGPHCGDEIINLGNEICDETAADTGCSIGHCVMDESCGVLCNACLPFPCG